MFRPNLFRSLILMSFALTFCSVSQAQHPGGHWQMPGIHAPQSQYQAPILDHYTGSKPALWDDQQPVERLFGEIAKRSWMRFEYLHWNVSRPGSVRVGAPLTDVTDPLIVFDNQNGTPAGEAVIPNLGNLGLDDTRGVRGTWGLDLANADFELQFFGTEQNSDSLSRINLFAGRDTGAETIGTTAFPNVAIPLLSGGGVASADTANYLIFDDSFSTSIHTQMWGGEATFLSKPYVPNADTSWQWLGGIRYIAYEEEFRNRGVNSSGGLDTPVVTTFGGDTINNMYGPEVGARMAMKNRWFSLSATPRIAFALNDYSANTQSSPLGVAGTSYSESDIDFTPIVQVSFTGEIHITPNFSIFGGYDFMWIYRMTRPFDNIAYDSVAGEAGGFVPDLRQQVDLESFYTRGLSVGCVLRY